MLFPREVLNRIRWQDSTEMSLCRVTYLHRGAENDRRTVTGDEIAELGRSFFSVGNSTIPYHRIRSISYDGEILFSQEG